MLQTIIIDDEKDARNAFRILVNKFVKNVDIIGEADNVKNGIERIKRLQPELVFLDINMQDGTGFDLLDQLETIDFHLVFITAYDQYAIKAFKYAALDYLLKPIDLQELRKCIERIKAMDKKTDIWDRLAQLKTGDFIKNLQTAVLSNQKFYKERFTIKKSNGIFLLKAMDVNYFFADDNLVFALDAQGKKHIISHRITELEALLDPTVFYRINRSEIINIQFIQRMEPYFGNRLVIFMKNASIGLKTSASKTSAFRRWLEGES